MDSSYSYIHINGSDLASRSLGVAGPPLVLVHANISDIRSWDPIVPKFSLYFRTITYSRRYAWPNAPIQDGAPDPWELQADDLAALIECLDIAPAHILGNSAGAFLELPVAKKRPELVKTLLLEEPPIPSLFLPHNNPPWIGEVLRLLFTHPLALLAVVLLGAKIFRPATAQFKLGEDEKGLEMFTQKTITNEFYERLSNERRDQINANGKQHKALFLHGSGLPQFLEEDARGIIGVPTLVITGEMTSLFYRVCNARLAALVPGAKEVVVKRVSYLTHEDNSDGVCDVVRSFVGV